MLAHRPAADTGAPHGAGPAAGVQVVVGDIPAQRTGLQPRPALLAQVNRAGQGLPAAVLTGRPGVGKTELAAAYARARLAGGWRLIAWVNARDSRSLLSGLASVAGAAGLLDGNARQDTAALAETVRPWLEADGSRCLLVLDDVADPGLLQPHIPAAGAARVLITMGGEPPADLGPGIAVGVFSVEEAVAFLDERTGLADESGAAEVAAELGCLPLALAHAAAVIAGQQLEYAAYLAKLRALRASHLVRRPDGHDGDDGPEQPGPQGAAEAVLLSLEAAYAADRLGVCTGVMEFMAMLSPAAVRRDLLRNAGQAGTLLGRGRRVAPLLVDRALERLDERSLLGFSRDGEAVSVHALVACVVRDEMVQQGRLVTGCQAAAATLEASAEVLASRPDHLALPETLSQVTALLQKARLPAADASGQLAGTAIQLRRLALHLLIEPGGDTAEAITIGEPLAGDLERLVGPGHPDTIRAQRDLASAYREAGRMTEAVPLLERALAAEERLLGDRHPSTLASRNNLGSAYRATGRPGEAIPLFELNAAACEELLGADHPRTVASRHSLDLARQEAAATAARNAQRTISGR